MEVLGLMKKIVCLLIVMLMSLGAMASCEELIQVDFANAFCLMRPADLEVVELNQDDASEGMVYAATNDALEMYVWMSPLDGMTAESLYEMWREDEFLSNVTVETAGTLSFLRYEIDGEGVGAVIACPDGNSYEIMFYCETEDATNTARTILDSLAAL